MSTAKDHISLDSSFKTAISPTVRKALVEFWGSDDIINRPEIIAELGPDSLSRINRIGRKSLHEIARALDSFGYIDSPGAWLVKVK